MYRRVHTVKKVINSRNNPHEVRNKTVLLSKYIISIYDSGTETNK